MVEPSDLNVNDLEDDKMRVWVEQYLDEATDEDWAELLIAIRDLGYHLGYKHGKEDVESGVYGKREEYTNRCTGEARGARNGPLLPTMRNRA